VVFVGIAVPHYELIGDGSNIDLWRPLTGIAEDHPEHHFVKTGSDRTKQLSHLLPGYMPEKVEIGDHRPEEQNESQK
jgi:hypothetical protein